MTDALNFRIELDSGTPLGEAITFKPGETISGKAVFVADQELTVVSLTTTITWHTEGKGNTDTADEPALDDVWTLEKDSQKLAPGRSLVRPFTATLPREPWSYDGKIVRIVWSVTATLDVPWAKDPATSRTFLLRP